MMKRNLNPSKDPEKVKEKKEKKEAKEVNRKRAEMIKKLSWTYGLGFGVVSVLILCVYSLFTISRATITTVALDNADQLKEVFFGGEPWVLQCIDENMTVSPAFITAAKKISVTAPSIRFGVIDCAGQLPSNRTVLERFKLPPVNYSASPTGFLFANSERPVQVPSKYVTDPKKLALWVEKYSEPAVKELSWGESFKKRCLGRDECAVIMTRGKLSKPPWLSSLMRKHRRVSFVSINRDKHKTSLDSKVEAGKEGGGAGLVVLTRTRAKGAETGGKPAEEFTYAALVHSGEWSETAVAETLTRALGGGGEALDAPPWFDRPPKRPRTPADPQAAQRNREWREKRRPSASGAGGQERARRESKAEPSRPDGEADQQRAAERAGRGSGGGETEEDRRLEAALRAEQQLAEDDDVVVSDIDDDDDGLV